MHKTLLRTLAALAGVAMPFALAAPAAASPEDGEGCAGLQSNPNAYICVISADPTAVPTVGPTGTSTTVYSENVCYVAGCQDVTVSVPDVAVTDPDNALLVVYYNGQTYSVGVVDVGGLPPHPPLFELVSDVLALGIDVALDAVDTALEALSWDGVRWLDCVVESETDDQVDIASTSSFSGYSLVRCTNSFFIV